VGKIGKGGQHAPDSVTGPPMKGGQFAPAWTGYFIRRVQERSLFEVLFEGGTFQNKLHLRSEIPTSAEIRFMVRF